MSIHRASGTLTSVGNDAASSDRQARGQAIGERVESLGIGPREWQRRTGIAPQTLKRAIDGDESVKPQTLDAVEAQLDRLEQMVGKHGNPVQQRDLGAGIVSITGRDGNRTITVEGPIGDIDKLERAVERLLRARNGGGNGKDQPPAVDVS